MLGFIFFTRLLIKIVNYHMEDTENLEPELSPQSFSLIDTLRNLVNDSQKQRTKLQNQRDELRLEVKNLKSKTLIFEAQNKELREQITQLQEFQKSLTEQNKKAILENDLLAGRLKIVDQVVGELGHLAFNEWVKVTQRVKNENAQAASTTRKKLWKNLEGYRG